MSPTFSSAPAPPTSPRRTPRPLGSGKARLVHHADGRIIVEPHPQCAPDGRLHRRHDHRARRGFSFNDVVGPRTAERGFLEGQEIIGSLELPSIGGGVCQTATTLFNDAFEIGLPILARTNHNLYLAHYPIGRDATVAWGGPDFRFKNDLKHAILIKTLYTDATLTFTFYGTSEHRRVVSNTGAMVNWTGPSMNYAVDPNALRGSVKVVPCTGEKGFDVTVDRTAYAANGKRLRHDTFKSHYIPDSPTTVYGPGKTPPGPYIVSVDTATFLVRLGRSSGGGAAQRCS